MRRPLAGAGLLLALSVGPHAQANLEVAFRAALETETVKGDLRSAIEQYRKVVEGDNRLLAAQALLRIGECYEKLGQAEAQGIYQRIVRDYTDQQDVVTLARARLASSERVAGQAGMVLRRLWTGYTEGTISRNGRYLSFVDSQTANLNIRDFATHTTRPVTSSGSWFGDFAGQSALSPDGAQVAYAWFVLKDDRYELRLADLSAGHESSARTVPLGDDVEYAEPQDWSPDGQTVVVTLQRKDRTAQIALVNVRSGAITVLKSVDWRGPMKTAFSPNGRYLGFDLPAADTSSDRDVFVLAVDGSRESTAVRNAGHDIMIGWSPDGGQLLFASDRNGAFGLWSVPVNDGRLQGGPRLIKANIGSTEALGVTSSGALFFGVPLGGRDIQLATVDLTTGRSQSPTVQPIQSHLGSNRWFDWSRDGRLLAYVSERGRNGGDRVIGIRELATGRLVRELVPPLEYLQGLSWSPDGGSFVTAGTDLKGRAGIYRIDAVTGEVSTLLSRPEESFGSFRPEWSPDGARLYYRVPGTASRGTVMELDVASGRQREIATGSGGADMINISPDGKWLGISSVNQATKTSGLVLSPIDGGEARELGRLNAPESWGRSVTWTPDGRGVLARKILDDRAERSELWYLPLAAGEPFRIDVDVNRIGTLSPIRIHPDGRRLAFFTNVSPGVEVWALENFLPASSAAR